MAEEASEWVRIRIFEQEGSYDGEVLARLADCLVLNVLGDEMTFAGTNVFRLDTITSEEPSKWSTFHRESYKPGWELRARSVDGDSLEAILRGRPHDRLLLVEEEVDQSEVCWIGFPTMQGDEVELDEVDPGGEFTESGQYAVAHVTRLAWGGGYIAALEERVSPGNRAVDRFAVAVRRFVEVLAAGGEREALQHALADLQLRVLELPDWESEVRVEVSVDEGPAGGLSSIGAALAGGLALYDADDRDAACAHWTRTHRTHWGEPLLDALRALHLAGR